MANPVSVKGLWKTFINKENTTETGTGIFTGVRFLLDSTIENTHELYTKISDRIKFGMFKPISRNDIQVFSMSSERNGDYYILKNSACNKYMKITPNEYFIYSQMDGKKTVDELVVSYFMEFHILAHERVIGLVKELLKDGFLINEHLNFWEILTQKINKNTLISQTKRFSGIFFNYQVSIKGLDKILTFMYANFFRLFFSRFFKTLYPPIAITGFLLFLYLFHQGNFSLFKTANSYTLGIFTMIMISIFQIMLHELAHAFAAKSYGREVTRGGFLFYFGIPGFFADTSDMWLGKKNERIAVSWAGPYSEIIFSSILTIVIFLSPDMHLSNLLFKIAFIGFLSAFINLNPLLELDGYYMLIDWLEIPQLRKKSFDFISNKLLKKLKSGESLKDEEKIFTLYGVLSFLWTVIAVVLSILFLKWRMMSSIREMFFSDNLFARIFSAFVFVIFVAPLILSLAACLYLGTEKLKTNLKKSKYLCDIRYVAALLITVSIFISFYNRIFNINNVLFSLLPVIIIILSAVILKYSYRELKGSSLVDEYKMKSAAFFFLGLIAVLGGFEEPSGFWSPDLLGYGKLISLFLSVLFLFLYAYRFFLNFDLSYYSETERICLGIMIPGTILLVAAVDQFIISINNPVPNFLFSSTIGIGLMTIVLLLPLIFNYLATDFAFSFIMEGIGIFVLICYSFLLAFIFSHKTFSSEFFYVRNIGILSLTLLCSSFFIFLLLYLKKDFIRPAEQKKIHFTDREKLLSSFKVITESLIINFRKIFGYRRTNKIIKDFNDYSVSCGLDILIRDGIVVFIEKDSTILELQQKSQESLDYLRKLLMGLTGKRLFTEKLIRIYDLLYWEEREVANLHLFSGLPWSADFLRIPEYKEDAFPFLLSNPLFSNLSNEDIFTLISIMKVKNFKPGDTIVKQGDQGFDFYIIRDGMAQVFVSEKGGNEIQIAELKKGDYFGERALLENSVRTATVKAISALEALIINQKEFNHLLKDGFTFINKIKASLDSNSILRYIPLFSEFSSPQLQYLSSKLKTIEVSAGEIIIKQNDPGEDFFIISKGSFDVFIRDSEGTEKKVSSMSEGEYFGEIALLKEIPRTATVKASSDGELLILHKDDFSEILKKSSQANLNLIQLSSRRLFQDVRNI